MITATHKQSVARIINAATNCEDAYEAWEQHCKAHGIKARIEDWGFARIGAHFYRLSED